MTGSSSRASDGGRGASEARLAVWPFNDRSGEPHISFFADMLVELIGTALGRLLGQSMASLADSVAFRYRSPDAAEMCRDLAVRYVLSGQATLTAAGTVCVVTTLHDGSAGRDCWSDEWTGPVSTPAMYEAHERICRRVVRTLEVEPGSTAEVLQTLRGQEPHINAMLQYLLAPAYRVDWAQQLRDTADRLVAECPRSAYAHAIAAGIYVDDYSLVYDKADEALARALAAARRGVELDQGLQLAWLFLAIVHAHRHDIDSFKIAAERTIAINPGSSFHAGLMGNYMVILGQNERGLELIKQAMGLNERYWSQWHMAHMLMSFRAADYSGALAQIERVDTSLYWKALMHSAILGQLGRHGDAHQQLQVLLAARPDFQHHPREIVSRYILEPDVLERVMHGLQLAGLPATGHKSTDTTE